MRLVFLLILLTYSIGFASAQFKNYQNDFKPAPMPRMGPVSTPKQSSLDKNIENISQKIAPGVISNMLGGTAGFVLKAADKFETMQKKKTEANSVK